MMKDPKHAVHFEINNMGAIKLLPRWMRSRGVFKTTPDKRGDLFCLTRDGEVAGKIIFCNQALTGRAFKQIGKYCRTLPGKNDEKLSQKVSQACR